MTPRTYAQRAASLDNLRSRHYAAPSERARAAREVWREQRVELMPGAEKGVEWEWGREKGKGNE